MSDQSVETQLALLKQRQEALETSNAEHNKATDAAIKALYEERTQALKYGVITLGSVVIGLIGWISSFISSHLASLTK